MSLPPERLEALACVLDAVIPPSADGRLPGAGALGLADALAGQPELEPVLEAGLAALDEIARGKGADGFAALPPGERRGALEESAAVQPAFLPSVIAQTLVAYYQDRRVLVALGQEGRPPFPLGYPVEETDFSILDPVRARDPFYREP